MTNEAASLALQCLLLRAVVEGQTAEIQRLQRQNDWLRRANRGLEAKLGNYQRTINSVEIET